MRFNRFFGILFSIFSAVLFGIFACIAYVKNLDFVSNALLGLATSALSIWITLGVIEKALKADGEERMSAIKGMTLKSLLRNICGIIYISPSAIGKGIKYLDSKLLKEHTEKIRYGALEPKEQVAKSILVLADMIDQGQKSRKQYLSDLNKAQDEKLIREERGFDAFAITHGYQDMNFRINRIREVLIPRILELIDDRELEIALLEFEEISDGYNEHMRLQLRNNDYPIHSERLVKLLKALAKVYVLSIKMI